ncbi:MAG: ROK family transcriptional regulator [Rhodothermaceae bacterium]|nr:ROK family transcriptional regulator [Rhodothermaceae bacterium]
MCEIWTMLTGTNLQYANNYNIRIVLETIRLQGPLSRIQIARRTNLTAQTVTNIVKKLLSASMIYESDRLNDGRGAPSIMLQINEDAAYSIGLDFDKDHLTGVLVNFLGKPRQRITMELDFPSPDEVMELMAEMAERLISMEKINREKIWGVGVCFPGPMVVSDDSVHTNAVNPQFLPGWEKVPVVKILEEKISLPVYLENNASAAAIGERWYGEGRYVGTFFYIFFGAGLGGGLIINGQLYPGYSGNAGELGYLPTTNITDSNPEMGHPHLGMYFSLPLLYKKLQDAGYQARNTDDLTELYRQKNPMLIDWLDTGCNQLAILFLAIEYLIDPEVIFFGGRLPDEILNSVLTRLNKILPTMRLEKKLTFPDMRRASAGLDAAALGVAILPLYASFAPVPKVLMKKNVNEEQTQSARSIF